MLGALRDKLETRGAVSLHRLQPLSITIPLDLYFPLWSSRSIISRVLTVPVRSVGLAPIPTRCLALKGGRTLDTYKEQLKDVDKSTPATFYHHSS
jgi:hypothetical protein